MEYIINDGHVTRTYDVKLDVSKLEEIIVKLKKYCYRVVLKNINVIANNEKEAITKINSHDANGIKIKKIVNISTKYEDIRKITKCPYVFKCEYLCKQNSYLVYILETILSNYRSSLNFKNQNNRLLDLLIQFENSEELKPYEKRIEEYEEKIWKQPSSDSLRMKNELSQLLLDFDSNKDYDFDLLSDLYNHAKDCFSLVLVAETVHYKDLDKNSKIYKLGANKLI